MISDKVSGTMDKTILIRKEVSNKFSFFLLVFVFVVVLFHSPLRYIYPFIEDLTAIANSYFFYVSSFFFYRGLNKKNIYERLKKRIITLLLPYLLWNVTYLMFCFNIIGINLSSLTRGFTVNNFCQPSWYLLTLFIFLMFSLFLKEAFKRIYSTVIVLVVGIVISYCGYILYQVELASIPIVGGYLIRMSEYLTPYLLGGIIGAWFDKKIDTSLRRNILGLISGFIIVAILLTNISPGIRWLLWVIFPIVLWNAIPEIMFKSSKLLCWVTEPAFFISMLHCYFLNVGEKLVLKYTLISEKKGAIFSVIFSMVMCYSVYYFLKNFASNILNMYMGNRVKKIL